MNSLDKTECETCEFFRGFMEREELEKIFERLDDEGKGYALAYYNYFNRERIENNNFFIVKCAHDANGGGSCSSHEIETFGYTFYGFIEGVSSCVRRIIKISNTFFDQE